MCPICASADISIFYEITNIPAHIGILWNTKEEALMCPKGNISLAFCGECGFIFNLDFDPRLLEYTGPYDNSLHFSPFYQDYARSVANRLVKNYNLYNKDIIEIGSGKGDFLSMLCEIGGNRGVGFDPSFDGKLSNNVNQITVIKDYYSERYSNYKGDLICSRNVFEHIQKPKEFLSIVRRTIGNRSNTIVYFEVPNVLLIIKDLSIWDIIYEHCSYFSLASLQRVFIECGFKTNYLTEAFEGQFVSIEAVASSGVDKSANYNETRDALDKISKYVRDFSNNYKAKLEGWRDSLLKLSSAKKKIVVWGAGGKGVSFLNLLKIGDQSKYIVDINPRKNGKYIPGTGQQIVLPAFLQDYKPDIVIVMNPVYKDEIQQTLKNLNVDTQLLYA